VYENGNSGDIFVEFFLICNLQFNNR